MALTTYPFITLTPGAANIKGAYTEIVASTPYASSRMYITFEFGGASQRFFLVDIATGAAASEVVVVADIAVDVGFDAIVGGFIPISVDVPAGTRLSARCQCPSGSIIIVAIVLEDRAIASIANPVTYGTDTSASRGTSIDPGAVANTKGAYVELTASSTARIDLLGICITAVQQGLILPGQRSLIDIAIGGAGSETIVIADVTVVSNVTDSMVRPTLVYFPVSIPIGTRISARSSCTDNTVVTRLVSLTLIGMQEPTTGSSASSAVLHGSSVIPYKSNYY